MIESTATREQLSTWLEKAQAEHTKMAARLELAIGGLRMMARLYRDLRLEKRDCLHANCGECKRDEDARA